MQPQRDAQLRRERDSLLDKLRQMNLMIGGSLVRGQKRCGRPACQCAQGRLHRHVVISRHVKGRSRITYVSVANDALAAEAVAQYDQVLEMLQRITTINIELLKAGRLDPSKG